MDSNFNDMVAVFPTVKVRRCPCCGGEPKIEALAASFSGSEFTASTIKIICRSCGITTGKHETGRHYRENFYDVLQVWNRRPGDFDSEGE